MTQPPVSARVSCFAAFAIQGFMFASLVTRLPTIKDRFDMSDYQVLLLLAVVAGLSAVGSVSAGYAAQRFGSAVVLRVALAAAALALPLIGLAGNITVLLLTTCIYGLFVGVIDATMNMQGVGIQDLYGRSIMVGFHGMWSLGAVIGGIYATVTLELDWPLFASLALAAVVALAANLGTTGNLLKVDPIDGPRPAAGDDHVPAVHIPWGPVILLAIPTFVMWFLDSATAAWSGIYLTDGLDAKDSAAPLAFTAYQAVLLLVRLFGDKLVRRFGEVTTVRASGVLTVVGVALIVAAPSLAVVVAGFGVLGAGLSMIPPLSMVAAGHLDSEGGGQALARVNVSNYVGYILAAVALATVAEQISHRAMFVIPLVLAPVIFLMAGRFAPRTRSLTS